MRLPLFVVVAMFLAQSCPEPTDKWDRFIEQDYEFGPHIEPSGESYTLHVVPEEGDSASGKGSTGVDFSS